MRNIFYRNQDKKDSRRKPAWREWLEAAVFALIVVTPIRMFGFSLYNIPSGSMEKTLMTGDYIFVNKWTYGARMPNTPLSIPFVQNTFLGFPSFSRLIHFGYFRFPGIGRVNRNDVVVFNFPAGDTVIALPQFGSEITYYQEVRQAGREETWRQYGKDIVIRPVDKRENFIKRCVAVAGDTLMIRNGIVFVNGRMAPVPPGSEAHYYVQTNGEPFNQDRLASLGIDPALGYDNGNKVYLFNLTAGEAKTLKQFSNVREIDRAIEQGADPDMFPHDTADYKWNINNYGPIYIPKKGATVQLNRSNIALYQRIISTYEGNKLDVKDGKIFINGKETGEYTFRMDYYWMMGDNRGDSEDSRFWGFVPEDHVVGKPVFVYFSKGKEGIAWSRLFGGIR